MFSIINKFLIFFLSIGIVFVASYYYLYRGFITILDNKDKIEYVENVINKEIKEKKYTIPLLLLKQKTEEYHWISDILYQFFKNKNKKYFFIELTLKKEGITQLNNLINNYVIQPDTNNKISLSIHPTDNNNFSRVQLIWTINSIPFNLSWYYHLEEQYFIFYDIKIDWILSILNYHWFNQFINDWFNIKYKELYGKKIKFDFDFNELIDPKIPESKKYDFLTLLNWIEKFIKLEDGSDELYFLFSKELKDTENKIKEYIKTNDDLSIWEKKNALIEIIDLTNKLENSELRIKKDKISLKNEDSIFFFNFNIIIKKIEESEFIKYKDINNYIYDY